MSFTTPASHLVVRRPLLGALLVILERSAALVALVLLIPVLVLLVITVRLTSPGPAIFRQVRVGQYGRHFTIYKFRTMTVGADAELEDLVRAQQREIGAYVKLDRDPRITRVGAFLRACSLDELPQFFNALFGSLSLVGPRPHAIAAQSHNLLYNEVVDGYFARHRVKPGVTGWAQINGWRGEMDTDEKIRMRTVYDLYYIENWSLWLDLKILFLTPVRLLNTENAY